MSIVNMVSILDNYAHIVKTNKIEHLPSAEDKISAIGLRFERLDSSWAGRAGYILNKLKEDPHNPEHIVQAIELGVSALANNMIAIPSNHANAHNYESFLNDTIKNVFHGKPRMFSVKSWEGFFLNDDRGDDANLDSKQSKGGRLTRVAIELWAKNTETIIDMLCTIQLLTKLKRK